MIFSVSCTSKILSLEFANSIWFNVLEARCMNRSPPPVSRIPEGLLRLLLIRFAPGFVLVALLALLTILGLLARIPKEERMLAAHFGDAYRNYSRKTGRLFPGP